MKNTLFLLPILMLLMWIQQSAIAQATNTWKNVAIGAGGFVSSIITSKTEANLVYARTDVGGAYRWDPVKNVWIPLTDWVSDSETGYLGVEALAIDPQDSKKVYMLVGIDYFNGGKTAILRSSDYGNTFSVTEVTAQFKAHGNGMGRQNGEKLVVDPNLSTLLFCGTRRNGLFKSTNSGATWSKVSALNVASTPNDNGISFVLIDPASGTKGSASKTIFAGVSRTGTNLYVSKDGGATFNAISGGPTDFMPQRAVLAADGNLFITYANGAGPHGHWSAPEPMDDGAIWKYNTKTGTWTNVTPSGYARAFAGICVDPNNSNRLVASTINTYLPHNNAWGDRIFLSTNGGTSWTDLFAGGMTLDANGCPWIANQAIHWAGSIEFDPFNTAKVWVTSGNGVFKTENVNASKTTWKFMQNGLEETVPLDMVSIPGGPLVSAIGDYDGFVHTDITKYYSRHTPNTGTTTGIAFASKNTSVMLRVGNDMYYSTNQGGSWTKCDKNGLSGVKGSVAISADGKVFLACPENSSTTYRSTDNGNSWTACSGINITGAFPVADAENPKKFYAFNESSGTMLVSTDGGVSFSTSGNAGSGGSRVIRSAPGKEGHLWVPLWNGLVRSTNSGQTFTKVNNVTYCGAVGLGKEAPGKSYPTIYIWGTINNVIGVYRSVDEGATWVRVNDNEHEFGGPGNAKMVLGDMNVYGRVYMSTAGRGIVYTETGTPDCAGVIGGSAYLDNCSTCVGGTTEKQPCVADCNGDFGGTAFKDNCDVCVGGKTGKTACVKDCNGVFGGTALIDNCNICVGGNTGKFACVKDCHGEYGGKAYLDNCQTCVGGSTGMTACSKDCNGDWGGTASLDVCNVCSGGKTGKVPVVNQRECTITSIDNIQSGEMVSVYPNPFNTDFTIASEGQFYYTIINFTGNTVAFGAAEGLLVLGADLSAGMYLVKVEKAGKTTIRKVVKY
ncbi:xyloglucanase [Sporocytophaga myxococcoides]|uniref:Xyloglucanase n=1 Tax=Sporocytophaga myxococcoides TaxID=153721 RepID=A0A098LKF2_9BACT|nr:T9SS type A sorting domain-containing protein [Sporocytophaga myxococcoides]GAL86787.1 xyloglucanase [Sporocytophaga myxococcoides]